MYFWSVSLVYQWSGQFLIFLVDQKKIWYTKKKFGRPKKQFAKESDQKYMDLRSCDHENSFEDV